MIFDAPAGGYAILSEREFARGKMVELLLEVVRAGELARLDMDQGKSCANAERSIRREFLVDIRRRRLGKEGNLAPAERGDFSKCVGVVAEVEAVAACDVEYSVRASFSETKECLR